jgi:hypothetical protein
MTVYLIHLDQPLSRGVSPIGTPLTAGHYIGWTDDLVGRILEHGDTTWTPLETPIVREDGKKISGLKHGPGSTFMGVVNARQIKYTLARTWDGADRRFEARLKRRKCAPKLCPICNPNALNLMKLGGETC